MLRTVMLCAVALACARAANAEDWIIGFNDPNEVVTQTADRIVDGDIVIFNNGRLNISGATITVHGDIMVANTGTLDVDGSEIRFPQVFSYQSEIAGYEAATLRFVDTTIDGGGHSHGIGLTGESAAEFERVTVADGFATWALLENATLTMTDCTNGGEFLALGENNSLDISGTDVVLFWMTLPDGSVVDTTLPPPGDVAAWSMDPNTPWASGIPYSVSLNNCTGVWWGVMAESGSSGTYRDSTLRVVGSFFRRSNEITVTGVANHASLGDTTYNWGDVALRFVDCSVQTWNFYAFGTTKLTLESCLFGEVLADESGEVGVIQSMCDGSGGYIGALGASTLWMWNSTNLSQTTCSHDATFIASHSALLSPVIDATDNSVMALFNTQYVGEPEAHDAAVIFDAAVEPVEAVSGDVASLRGSARLIAGPDSPFVFEGYTLEYGVGDDPNAVWTSIGGPFPDEVRDAELGAWDTCGRVPGDYQVRLALLHNLGDPITNSSQAALSEPPGGYCVGDLNCDGGVFLSDLAVLLASFMIDGGGDLDGDGDTDLADLATILANWEHVCP